MSSNNEQDRIDHLLDLARQGEGAELDPNDVAQLAAGRPEKSARAALEARLASAPIEDQRTVAALAAATPSPAQAATRRMWWAPVSAAAMVLVAVGAAWLLNRPTATTALDDTALARAFVALRETAPEAFSDVKPILGAERTETEPMVQRGGIRVFVPRGALRDSPPDIQWQRVPGAKSYDVRALSDEGDELFHEQQTETRMGWPRDAQLVPGMSYVVTIATLVGGVRARGSAAFRVLSEQELAQYDAGLQAIERVEPSGLRGVLRSQFALRRGLIQDARKFLDEAVVSGHAHDLVQETKSFLARMHGDQ